VKELDVKYYTREVVSELSNSLVSIDSKSLISAMELIKASRKKFFLGLGRGGLAIKSFEMRLFHLGMEAYEVWGINTPPIARDDLLVVVSSSGNTETTVNLAKKAKGFGAKLLLLTTNADSVLGRMADSIIVVSAPSMKIEGGKNNSVQIMNSLFEQTLFTLGDIITLCLTKEWNIDSAELEKRHANLE
jgi:6-phospho-3-hexuloisomerase